jgi:hypothetical protein
MTEAQKKLALRVIQITVVLVPVVGGALAALITGSPFDWGHAIQVVLPALMGTP